MVLFVQKVGIIGAGVMGQQIADIMALNGKAVILKDVEQGLLDNARSKIEAMLEELVQFHKAKADREIKRIEEQDGFQLTDDQKAKVRSALRPTYDGERKREALTRIKTTLSWDDFREVDLVIEAVYEDSEVKKKVFMELGEHTPTHAVLATNTSSLSITEIASATKNPSRVLGVHFFNPATTLPIVEVIPGLETREDILNDMIDFLTTLRNHRYPLQPVRVKEVPGFVVNRILGAMLWEAFALYEEGAASMRDLDLVMRSGAGMPMGPFELADLIGIDILYHVEENIKKMTGQGLGRGSQLIRKMYLAGRWGRKVGQGFYDYR